MSCKISTFSRPMELDPARHKSLRLPWDILMELLPYTISYEPGSRLFRGTLSRLMQTCRTLYFKGIPLLLQGEIILPTWESIYSFSDFILLSDPHESQRRADLIRWMYIPISPKDGINIIKGWPEVFNLDTYARDRFSHLLELTRNVERLHFATLEIFMDPTPPHLLDADPDMLDMPDCPFTDNMMELSRLTELQVDEMGALGEGLVNQLYSAPLAVVSLTWDWYRKRAALLNNISNLLYPYIHTLTTLSINDSNSWFMLPDDDFPGNQVFHNVHTLNLTGGTCDFLAESIMHTLPNLKHLTWNCRDQPDDSTLPRDERDRLMNMNGIDDRGEGWGWEVLETFRCCIRGAFTLGLMCKVNAWDAEVLTPDRINQLQEVLTESQVDHLKLLVLMDRFTDLEVRRIFDVGDEQMFDNITLKRLDITFVWSFGLEKDMLGDDVMDAIVNCLSRLPSLEHLNFSISDYTGTRFLETRHTRDLAQRFAETLPQLRNMTLHCHGECEGYSLPIKGWKVAEINGWKIVEEVDPTEMLDGPLRTYNKRA
ncbi:hypothetical protein BXZ70DRAFT_1012073 [Cristinia sonorae]|uniref:Uncharacterized protein n=1 Tax=Cristinia sonorae TaxID=1940300 RepID=A0A8K0UF11_9AGAR|nr:hypothetical protein BXZ70DRAFT_1012073 [Cristinia sonorae]